MDLLKEKQIGNKTVYYGFSIGAYLLIELASKVKIDKIVLISPSPLFSDTIKIIPKEDRKDFDLRLFDKSLEEMCDMINCEVEVYVGDKEIQEMKDIALKVANKLGVQLQAVKDLGHEEKLFEKVLSIESQV
ncbi:MAG: hypothetical protein U9P50_02035 [Patescibacteria group bacterium]|nr:hypothetical protein [Patescibacteria group bacterium]